MGFELYTDLILADYLCSQNLAKSITFHVKAMPWFVSDTVEQDFPWALATMMSSESSTFQSLGTRWKSYIDSGRWNVTTHQYWTLPFEFSLMKEKSPDLYTQLGKSQLLIIKGDLNYRKLVHDLIWDTTTPFPHALRGFFPAPLVALRTLKCDAVVGLPDGLSNKLDAEVADWRFTGSYALIQFSQEIRH